MLEERNWFEAELQKVNDRLKFSQSELERLQTTMSKSNELYSDILNIRSMQVG